MSEVPVSIPDEAFEAMKTALYALGESQGQALGTTVNQVKAGFDAVRAAAPHIARAAQVQVLREMAEELEAEAEDLRRPLPQGDQDQEAREAVDQQAIGMDLASDELRYRADQIERGER